MLSNLSELYTATFTNGSGTFWLDGHERTNGYVVALAGYEIRANVNVCKPSLLLDYANDLLAPHADGIGLWYDENSGHVYIDSVLHVDSFEYAVEFGKLNKQFAIYDIANSTVINL